MMFRILLFLVSSSYAMVYWTSENVHEFSYSATCAAQFLRGDSNIVSSVPQTITIRIGDDFHTENVTTIQFDIELVNPQLCTTYIQTNIAVRDSIERRYLFSCIKTNHSINVSITINPIHDYDINPWYCSAFWPGEEFQASAPTKHLPFQQTWLSNNRYPTISTEGIEYFAVTCQLRGIKNETFTSKFTDNRAPIQYISLQSKDDRGTLVNVNAIDIYGRVGSKNITVDNDTVSTCDEALPKRACFVDTSKFRNSHDDRTPNCFDGVTAIVSPELGEKFTTNVRKPPKNLHVKGNLLVDYLSYWDQWCQSQNHLECRETPPDSITWKHRIRINLNTPEIHWQIPSNKEITPLLLSPYRVPVLLKDHDNETKLNVQFELLPTVELYEEFYYHAARYLTKYKKLRISPVEMTHHMNHTVFMRCLNRDDTGGAIILIASGQCELNGISTNYWCGDTHGYRVKTYEGNDATLVILSKISNVYQSANGSAFVHVHEWNTCSVRQFYCFTEPRTVELERVVLVRPELESNQNTYSIRKDFYSFFPSECPAGETSQREIPSDWSHDRIKTDRVVINLSELSRYNEEVKVNDIRRSIANSIIRGLNSVNVSVHLKSYTSNLSDLALGSLSYLSASNSTVEYNNAIELLEYNTTCPCISYPKICDNIDGRMMSVSYNSQPRTDYQMSCSFGDYVSATYSMEHLLVYHTCKNTSQIPYSVHFLPVPEIKRDKLIRKINNTDYIQITCQHVPSGCLGVVGIQFNISQDINGNLNVYTVWLNDTHMVASGNVTQYPTPFVAYKADSISGKYFDNVLLVEKNFAKHYSYTQCSYLNGLRKSNITKTYDITYNQQTICNKSNYTVSISKNNVTYHCKVDRTNDCHLFEMTQHVIVTSNAPIIVRCPPGKGGDYFINNVTKDYRKGPTETNELLVEDTAYTFHSYCLRSDDYIEIVTVLDDPIANHVSCYIPQVDINVNAFTRSLSHTCTNAPSYYIPRTVVELEKNTTKVSCILPQWIPSNTCSNVTQLSRLLIEGIIYDGSDVLVKSSLALAEDGHCTSAKHTSCDSLPGVPLVATINDTFFHEHASNLARTYKVVCRSIVNGSVQGVLLTDTLDRVRATLFSTRPTSTLTPVLTVTPTVHLSTQTSNRLIIYVVTALTCVLVTLVLLISLRAVCAHKRKKNYNNIKKPEEIEL